MPIGKKIRIYDLAREIKQDAKRVMEDLRREGADVNVPSYSVSAEMADKVRLKYFPKTEVAPKRGIKIIKAAKKKDEETTQPAVEEAVEAVQTSAPVEVPEIIADEPAAPAESPVPSVRKVLKKKPAVEAPIEAEPAPVPEVEEVEPEIQPAAEESEEPPSIDETTPTAQRIVRPGGTQIKQLTLTRDALQKGVKPGERVISDAPTRTGKLDPDRVSVDVQGGRDARGRRTELRGTPGETATPHAIKKRRGCEPSKSVSSTSWERAKPMRTSRYAWSKVRQCVNLPKL